MNFGPASIWSCVLCHSGISRLASTPGEENAGQDLAKLDGVDALFLGHQHLLLPGEDFVGISGVDAERGTIYGKPAVMAGFWGSHLGIIDLELEKDAAWRVTGARVEVRPIARRDANGGVTALTQSDISVLDVAKAAHEATLRHIRTPIGRLATPLNTYLALIGDARRSDSSTRLNALMPRPSSRRARTSPRCQSFRRRRRSNAAAAAAPIPIPTSPLVRSRSRMWRISTRIPTV